MISNSSIKIDILVDLAIKDINGINNADYRKITLQDTTDYTGIPLGELKGYFKVINPLGIVIHDGNFTTPDIVQNTSLVFDSLEVPLDSFGNILNGNYIVQYFVQRDSGTIVEYNTEEIVFNICNSDCSKNTIGDISIEINCNAGLVTGIDNTKYSSGSSVNRILTLVPPVGSKYSNGVDASNYVSVINTVQSDALWTTVWQLLLRAEVEHSEVVQGMGYILREYVEAKDDAEAVCEINLCSLYKCYNKELASLNNQACLKGGMANNLELQDRLNTIVSEYLALEISRGCGNKSEAIKHYNILKDLLDCDCGCDSGDSTVPVLIEPIMPTSNNVQVLGSNPIVVTPNVVGTTTVYTVSLSSALTNTITSFKNVNVESTDGSVVISETDTPTLKTFDLSVDTDAITQDILTGLIITCLGLPVNATFTDVIQELINRACQPPPPPVAENDFYSTMVNDEITFLPTVNDFGSTNLTVTITTPPLNGSATVQGDNKSIKYIPDTDWTGVETIGYTVTDQYGQTSNATITIVVNPAIPATCNIINAAFVASNSVEDTDLTITILNQTAYNGNIPTSVLYFIEIRDESNVVIHSYPSIAGNNNSVPTIFNVPDTVAVNWNNIKITMWVTSENTDGVSCGTDIIENTFIISDISVSIFAGTTADDCIGFLPADSDTEKMQKLLDKLHDALNPLSSNGLHTDTTNCPATVKLGGTLIEDTTIDGDKFLNFDVARFRLTQHINTDDKTTLVDIVKEQVYNEDADFSNENAQVMSIGKVSEIDGNYVMASLGKEIRASSIYHSLRIADNSSISRGYPNLFNYGTIRNLSLGFGVDIITNNSTLEDVANLTLGAVYRAGLPTNLIITNYASLYIKDLTNATEGGNNALVPTNRWAIYQEGTTDKNEFFGNIIYHNSLVNASDERSKENIEATTKGLTELLQIKVVEFNKKEGFGNTKKRHIGVIAQQIETILPNTVETIKNSTIDDFKAINQSDLLYVAINAIKELNVIVEEQKVIIADLKSRIETLEKAQ